MLGYSFCRIWQSQTFVLLASGTESLQAMVVFWLAGTIGVLVSIPLLARCSSLRSARSRLAVATCTLATAGTPSLIAGATTNSLTFAMLGALCTGFALGLSWLLWADRFSTLPMRDVYFYTVASAVLMIAINFLSGIGQFAPLMLIALSPILCMALLVRDWGRDTPWAGRMVPDAGLSLNIRGIVGLFTVTLLFPFAYHVCTTTLFVETSSAIRDGGDLIATLIFAAVALMRQRQADIITAYRVSVPVVLLGFILCCMLPDSASLASGLVMGAGFKLAQLFFWALCVQARVKGVSHWTLLGIGMAARLSGNSLALFLNLAAPSLVANSETQVILAAVVSIVTCVVFWTLPLSRETSTSPADETAESGSSQTEQKLERLCQDIARTHMLTPRESEVLLLLAQGRNRNRIAEMLGIKPGTAHTHIISVYGKLGIHNQQELIALVREN